MTETRQDAHEARLGQLREVLARRGFDAGFLETRRNFAWLTAGGANHIVTASETGVAGLLVTPRDVVVVTSTIERDRIDAEETGELGLDVEAVDWWLPEAPFEAARARAGGRSVARDVDLEADLVPLRSRLSPLDQDRLVKLGREAARVVEEALGRAEPGMTEQTLAADLAGSVPGARTPVILVAADERIPRFRHPNPSSAPIRDRVMLVLVLERWGLNAAVTRFREWAPLDEGLVTRFDAVRQVERAMHEATRPGATLGEVIEATQEAYARVGHPDAWREHHQGGTIAYQGRETVGVPGDRTPIEPGMAFAWNPSIAGVKVEDTFILEADGSRRVVTAS